MGTTRILLDRLHSDISLRRICGWEYFHEIPSESTFSRAFAEFSQSQFPELIHKTLIKENLENRIIGHISCDATAINSCEKPETDLKEEEKKEQIPKKQGRPKKIDVSIPKEKTQLQKQSEVMPLDEMLKDLPKLCNVGTKKNSKGYKESWIDYKLHIDSADGRIPISYLLSSIPMHDTQTAMTWLMQLMILQRSKKQNEKFEHIAIIDTNQCRNKALKNEAAWQRCINLKNQRATRYNERSTVEWVNGRLKDEFGGRVIRVKGNNKIMCHLMLGIVALTVDQLMTFIQ